MFANSLVFKIGLVNGLIMKLKVYYMNYDGRVERLVAATNMRKAAELMRVKEHELRNMGGQTDNPDSVSTAMSSPGMVFKRSITRYGDPWVPLEPTCN